MKKISSSSRNICEVVLNRQVSVVNSYNEWDPLQEVIVGRVEGAAIPQFEANVKVYVLPKYWDVFQQYGGHPFPEDWVEAAAKELNELCRVLEGEDIIVRRPDIIDSSQPYKTP